MASARPVYGLQDRPKSVSFDLQSTSSLGSRLSSAAGGPGRGLELKHGILTDYQVRVGGHIKSVIFNPHSQTTTVHHAAGFSVYNRNSIEHSPESKELAKRVTRLLYDKPHNVYVAVCADAVLLLNTEFEVIYEWESSGTILNAVINSWTGEVVISGSGHITTMIFKQGGKVIAPSMIITDGLSSDASVSLVHIENVPGKAQRCFAVADTSVTVYLMSSGKVLASLRELHSKPISALFFFRPLRLLITAAKDGAIKVWDSSWDLVCTFVGHCGSVTSLCANPYGPMVISGARDCTIRAWNLATQDQTEIISHTTPVEGLHSEPGACHLMSFSGRQLKAWRVQQLYHQSALTGPVTFLRATSHPLVPLRVIAGCVDAAVRLVSPVTGQVLTTALLPIDRKVVSVAYFSYQEVLHVLDDAGCVSVFDTTKNPSSLISSWSTPQDHNIGEYTCLCLYEVASDDDDIEETLANDKWLRIIIQAKQPSHIRLTEKSPLEKSREGHSYLLAGTTLGFIALVSSNGEVKCSMRSPSDSTVCLMTCNAKRNQIITVGQDGGIDVWRLYPHTIEPLSHLLSFHLPSSRQPCAVVSTRDRLAVASNNTQSASYSVDMFDLVEQVSYTSQTEYSHVDEITALEASPKLRLFASTSLDCTLRIWTDNNHPMRVLCLDSPPTGLVFCSLQADLMIALHSHLHIITNSIYANDAMRNQLVSTKFPDLVAEDVIGWSVELGTLPSHDQQRLMLIDNTISQDDYKGALSAEEMAALEEAGQQKALCLEAISAREAEIRAIRDGKLTAKNKREGRPPLKGKEKENFWKEFLSILRPGEPKLNFKMTDFYPHSKVPDKPTPDPTFESGPRYKFFPPLATFEPPYPLAPDGHLPNSVLLNSLRKSEADQELAKGWSPPTISDKQRRLLEEMEEEEEEDEEVGSDHDDELMARLNAALAHRTPTPSPSPSPPPTPDSPPPRKTIAPHKPIQKLIAKPPPPKPVTPPRTPTPPPPKTPTPPPTPPPPPTPLPEFIAQFIGESWFDKLFPNADSKTFPKPWTVSKFIYTLLSFLPKSVDSITKGNICMAILKLIMKYNPANKPEIYTSVLSLLTTQPAPSPHSMAERHLIQAALKLLFQLPDFDPQFAALLMAHYVLGDSELRRLIANQFVSKGVSDPEGYFERMLSMMSEEESFGDTENALLWSGEWLNDWSKQLSASKGNTTNKGSLPSRRSLKPSVSSKKSVTRQSKVSFKNPSMATYDPIAVINYYVVIEHQNELARNRVVTPPPKPPTPVPEDELPHNTVVALPKINRNRGLIRLGETHCSSCHPDRETSLALVHRLPPHYNTPNPTDPTKLWRQFTHCLTLALTPQNINPFLSDEEKQAEKELEDYLRSQRLSVSSMVKYFIPERSYVNTDK